MGMKRFYLAILTACLMASAAQAKSPAPPREVIDAVQALVVDGWLPYDAENPDDSGPPPPKVDDATIQRWQKTGLLKRINLTPGPLPDYLIDTEKTEYPAAWCGTGGCLIEIWSPGADGRYVKIFHNQIRDRHFRHIPGTDHGWMEVDFHGYVCGQAGVVACPWGFEWRDDGLGKPALRASLRFLNENSIHAGAAPQALDPGDSPAVDSAPAPLQTLIAAQIATCADLKGSLSPEGMANRMPDLNGDGIDDWSYDGFYLSCDYADGTPAELEEFDFCTRLDCGRQVWVSRRDGDAVAWDQVPLDQSVTTALALHPGHPPTLIALVNRPGFKDDEDGACYTFLMEQCVEQPISLSPKP